MQIITDIPASVMMLSQDCEFIVPDASETSHIPNIDSLNRQQKIAFELMRNYITAKEPPYRAMLLEGYAGTGKTYLIAQLIKHIIMMEHKKVAITAPTNKAVKVLRKTAGYKHHLLVYKTIHALLGLQEDIDDKGKQSFVRAFGVEPEIDEVGVLIVDETSMLPDELFEMINEHIEKGLKVIFMGDPIQIPPVNKPDCVPFIEKHRETFDIYRVTLTDVVRQKEGNPILDLATTVRGNVQSSLIPFDFRTQMTSQGGIIMINKVDKPSLYEVCEHYFSNPRFHFDPDFIKVIAWTNNTVNWMNNKIRLLLYKEHVTEVEHPDGTKEQKLAKLMIGEKLIADKPIMGKKQTDYGEKDVILFTTNDEFEVLRFDSTTVNAFGNYHVPVYRALVQMIDETGKKKVETINIVHESGEAIYSQVMEALRKAAINERDKDERRAKWRNFFRVKNKFAEVKYNYCITAHKSQGSTYDNAIVIEPDIDKNQKVVERNRIKYVAYTRAKNLLFIVK